MLDYVLICSLEIVAMFANQWSTLFLIQLVALFISVNAQNHLSPITSSLEVIGDSDSLGIQYLDITNNKILTREIKKFIQEQNDSSDLFKRGFGYITVGNCKFNQLAPVSLDSLNGYKKNEVLSFRISIVSYMISANRSPYGTICHNCYPVYYSFVDHRLILIYDKNMKWVNGNNYSYSSRRTISRLVRKTLLASLDPKFQFLGSDGKKYSISQADRLTMSEQRILENCAFSLNKGKSCVIYSDGTIDYSY